MPRYLVLGGSGMLARDLVRVLDDRDVVAPSRDELDITDASAVRAATAGVDAVINAAAYTRVDDAESDEAAARLVNAEGARIAAEAAAAVGAEFVQLSTDYVFDGTAREPYAEDAPRNPLGAYGRTKAEGEELVLATHPHPYIVRTAWLYGRHGRNFPQTMLHLARERETVDVVVDQMGQPTWTYDLATAIVRLLDADAPSGIYHGTNSGSTTWYEAARAVFELAGLDPERVRPTDSTAFVRPAPRPAYSVLGHAAWGRVGLPEPRPWRDALAEAMAEGALTPA